MQSLKLTKKYAKYSEYKDSGVEWLGDIPESWMTESSKRVFKEKNFRGEQGLELGSVTQDKGVVLRSESDLSVWNPQGETDGYKTIRTGEFVLSLRSFEGGVEYSEVDALVSPAYTVMSLSNEHSKRYFKWLLKSDNIISALQIHTRGIRQGKNISFQDFSAIDLVIPPKTEQEKIARFLDEQTARIDETIAKKQKLIELITEQIFGLVIGFQNDVEQVNEGLWKYGKKTWTFEKAKRVFEEVNKKGFGDKQLLAVTQDRGVLPKADCEENFVSAQSLEGLKLVENGDFVISLRSFQGGIEYSEYTGLVSPAYTVLKLKDQYDDESFRLYYYYLLKSPQFIGMLNTAISGIRDGKNINYSDFCDLVIPIPDKKSCDEIVGLHNKLKIIKSIHAQSKKLLEELKSSLISHAVTGKIKV